MYTPLELPLFSRIFHYVFMDIITAIIKLENESNRNSSDKPITQRGRRLVLSFRIHFIFITKKYTSLLAQNPKHTGYSDVLHLLSSLRTEYNNMKANDFQNYVKKWTQIQSRVGLIQ